MIIEIEAKWGSVFAAGNKPAAPSPVPAAGHARGANDGRQDVGCFSNMCDLL
jgi:hypothetical protein